MKISLNKRWFQAGLAGLILTASAGVSYGDIVYTFNSSADTTPWINGGQAVAVTPSFVADAPPYQSLSTGSLGWTGTFGPASTAQFGGLKLTFPSVNLTSYTDFQFDVKVLNNSFDRWGQIQSLQPVLGIGPTDSWNQSSYQPQLTAYSADNGWQHFDIPLIFFSSGSLSDVRQILFNVYDGNYLAPTSMQLAFDNISFTTVPEPSSWLLFAFGVVALGFTTCYRRKLVS
jgi:hypothetical protein